MTSLAIAFLLIFGPLITESLRISELKNHLRDVSIDEHKKDYLKRELSIRVIPRSDSSITGIYGQTYNESIEAVVPFNAKKSLSKPKIPNNNLDNKKETQSESKYKSLAIVCSVCAVIVLCIGLIFAYIHFGTRNKSSQEILAPNVLQLNTISRDVNLNLDVMAGTHYLNRGVMAFNDISQEILTVYQNNNFEKVKD